MEEIAQISPDKEKAKSILKMVELRLEMLALIPTDKYASPLVEENYELAKELITAIMCAQGFKTLSHVALIEFLRQHHRDRFSETEIDFLDKLRRTRNRIAYNGYFVPEDFIERRKASLNEIINKLKGVLIEVAK